MNISKMGDICIFGGKADICKEFNFHLPSHGVEKAKPAKQSTVDGTEAEPVRRVGRVHNDMSTDEKAKPSNQSTVDGTEAKPVRRVGRVHNDMSTVGKAKPAKQSAVDGTEAKPLRRVGRVHDDMSACKEMPQIKTGSFVVSPESYKTLLDNLYVARLSFLRVRNITMNQLNVYKEEAIEHMQEIARIARDELGNAGASADSLAKELVITSTKVIRGQQTLNRIEMEELVKDLDSLLDKLSSDVEEIKESAEPEYEDESEQRSFTDFIFDCGHWCFFILCVSVVLFMGLSRYLPVFEEYL